MSMDPNSGPALPPELMALLQGGGGQDPSGGQGPSGGQDPNEPPESSPQDATEDASELPDDPVGLIQLMIAAAKKYMDVEPDEEDKLTMAKNVLANLQQYLAKDQKDGEQMLSGTISPRALRKAGGPAGGPSGAGQ